jgi:hypothetical protein
MTAPASAFSQYKDYQQVIHKAFKKLTTKPQRHKGAKLIAGY